MNLRHATPARHVDSIMAEGLDPQYTITLSSRKYVWLHGPRHTAWAIKHTAKRLSVPQHDVEVLNVSVPRRWLFRAWPGVWNVPI